jgi:formate hydrogenlyase subunit 6/NADH:ubiquinone oxidoreductase subunit I
MTKRKPTLCRRRYLNHLGIAVIGSILGSTITTYAMKKITPIPKGKEKWVLPPKATTKSMQNNCIRCGLCIDACPAKILKPVSEKEGSRAWTPLLTGTCPPNCSACSKACPTEAIPKNA